MGERPLQELARCRHGVEFIMRFLHICCLPAGLAFVALFYVSYKFARYSEYAATMHANLVACNIYA